MVGTLWICIHLPYSLIKPCHEKTCSCHMRRTKTQISPRIRAAWSTSLLFAAEIVGYLWLLNPKVKTLASFCSWADRFESYLVRNYEVRFSHDVALGSIVQLKIFYYGSSWVTVHLTHICPVDVSILINSTSPFPILWVSGVLFHIHSFSNRNFCKPWSDAAFRGFWSGVNMS